jgi:predicted metallo-beta-lactamase superfamily hydrolase
MCTLVQTPDTAILLDAGISLCPWRFNLPPHPLEFQAIQAFREKIRTAADKAQIVTVSHYHYDHHTPSFEDWIVNWTCETETARQIYQDKELFIKNPKENINASQQTRAGLFLKTGARYAKKVQEADGQSFTFGNTRVHFSEAVFHGEENSTLGYVIMTIVEYADERFLFAPDIQGPMCGVTCKRILDIQPDLLMLGGPPFYLAGLRVTTSALQKALEYLGVIVKNVPWTILEHHTLRDEQFKQKIAPLQTCAEQRGHRLLTAAEFRGEENNFLEANRRDMYKTVPVSEKFQSWIKNLKDRREIVKPPL